MNDCVCNIFLRRYFPTYLLGAIMAAQLDHYVRLDMPDFDAQIERGEFANIKVGSPSCVHHLFHLVRTGCDFTSHRSSSPLFCVCVCVCFDIQAWLQEKVHNHGSRPVSMDALLQEQFGEPLNPKYFIKYLTDKFSDLYKL
jgi:carboxypeptidase Taq